MASVKSELNEIKSQSQQKEKLAKQLKSDNDHLNEQIEKMKTQMLESRQ